jgi:hypothetical protein
MIGHMPNRVIPTLALLLCASLTGCQSGGDATRPTERVSTPTSLAASPQQPHVTTNEPVTLMAGLTVMTDDQCSPEETRRVCSADGAHSWVPLTAPADATVVEALTHLAHGHTSWTAVLRFAPEDHQALRRTAQDATASGGVLLVLQDRRVLAAVPAADVHGTLAVVTDLDKPTAWDMVGAFAGS